MKLAAAALIAFGLLASSASAEDYSHKPGEQMPLWLNKVGPYHNPHETYSYYTLPFCSPTKTFEPSHKPGGIGEVLEGHDLLNSMMEIKFAQDTRGTLCSFTLTPETTTTFAHAISNHYWYQMYFDDLPIWGMVGELVASEEELRFLENNKYHDHETIGQSFVYCRKKFSVSYNGDRVIEVNLTSEDPQPVQEGQVMQFQYEVKWTPTQKEFKDRFNRYLDYSFFEHQIHWFSIFNSFMMVVFLCGLVALILMRTLRNDYAKYARDEDDLDGGAGFGDDSGWKQVHGDVFRRPDYIVLFSAMVGSGFQLVYLAVSVILFAIAGTLYTDRGAMVTAFIVCYALTSIVGGYKSGAYYNQYFYPNPAPQWIKTMVMTSLFLPGVAFTVVFPLNCIAYSWGTLNVIPFRTLFSLAAIYLLAVVPLTVAGTILGRHWSGRSDFPCRINAIPRPIPEKVWFTQPFVVVMLTGILPFGSIFIEMYFIFTSFWNYKFYYVYGFMLLVFSILFVVTVCVTIVAVYFMLNAEDYRWKWMSYFAGGSTAFYVYGYAIYYFFVKTNMHGFLQTSFYFGYMYLFCFAIFVMCGTIGNMGASLFIDRIYRNIKVD